MLYHLSQKYVEAYRCISAKLRKLHSQKDAFAAVSVASCQFHRTVNGVRCLPSQHKLSSWIIFFIWVSGESAAPAPELSLTSTHHHAKKQKSSPQTSFLNIITPIIQIPHVPLVWSRGKSGNRECSHETDLPV